MAAELLKREREANCSHEEKDCFLEFMAKHISVIDDKRNDTKMISKKKDVWRIIKSDMESLGYEREISKLRQQWMRMKAHAKTNLATVRKARTATGNLVEVPELSHSDEEVVDMIQIELQEDSILIDSNTECLELEELDQSHHDESEEQPKSTEKRHQRGDNLVNDLRKLPKKADKHDVLQERRKQIQKETEMHKLKIKHEKELHSLQMEHMIELHELKKQLLMEQIKKDQSNPESVPLIYLN
ncbi:uncharacterized protein LOC118749634 [Rhagoletis pomonella]|uniref:uncharacterized protein LOC118749634 n=1 Tax=Rhagoletis pomonella TaxID=28610 RepID=UPI00178345BD|nr:uncharacterized protein LOC118749634 [Rhagoletis pomonella]